jgi:hypothetical protein
MNDSVNSPLITEVLAEAQEQETKLDELAAGKEMGLLKAMRSSSTDARRPGAKRASSSISK